MLSKFCLAVRREIHGAGHAVPSPVALSEDRTGSAALGTRVWRDTGDYVRRGSLIPLQKKLRWEFRRKIVAFPWVCGLQCSSFWVLSMPSPLQYIVLMTVLCVYVCVLRGIRSGAMLMYNAK